MASNSTTTTTTTTSNDNTMPPTLTNMYAEAKRRIPPLDRASTVMSNKVNTLKANSQCVVDQAKSVWNTDEIKDVRNRFWMLMESLGVVGMKGCDKGMDVVEGWVGVDGEGEGNGEGQEVGDEDKPSLLWRVGRVGGKCWETFEKKIGERERKVQGTMEEKVYVAARYLIAVILALLSMFVDWVSKYQGPGKEVVGDIAGKVQRIIPTQNGDINPAETVGVLPSSPASSDSGMLTPPASSSPEEHNKMD